MREATWRAGKQPLKMFAWVAGRFSTRRMRLFACACARLGWEALAPAGRHAVEAAEAFADDPGAFAAMRAAGQAVGGRGAPERWQAAQVCTRVAGATAARAALAHVRPAQALVPVLHCQFGIPHRELVVDLAWTNANDGAAVRLAREIYLNRTFSHMPILADALEDAGCTDVDVLSHCRDVKEHWRGCWALEMLLEPEAGPGNPVDRLREPAPASAQRSPASRLFLPHSGWLVRVKEKSTAVLDAEAQAHVRPWRDPPTDEFLLADAYDPVDLKTAAGVRSVKRVWFLTSRDPVPLPPRASGRSQTCGDVQTLLYTNHDTALDDLGAVHEPIRLLRELIASGAAIVRKQARAALAGDWRALTALAETLRSSGHPRAAEVMWLSGAEAPAPAPAATAVPAPAPRPPGDPELETAQVAATSCPQCGAKRFARRVRKPGPNINRIFLSCSDRDCNSFEWVTSREQAAAAAPGPVVAAAARPLGSLLVPVRERPDDDGVRRDYADTLAKQGHSARAEFVRVQCDLAALPPGDPAAASLRRREFELLAEHGDTWAAAVAPHVTRYEFRRGALEHIETDAPGFVRDGAMLQGEALVCSLRVRIRGWQDLQAVVAAPAFGLIRELEVTGFPTSGAGGRILAESANAAGLIALRFAGANLGRGGVAALSGSANLCRLRRLDLSVDNIGKGGASQLAASPPMSHLESLTLAGNNVPAAELEVLLRSPYLSRLRSLDLSNTGFTTDHLEVLLRAPRLAQLEELRLAGKGVGRPAAKRLGALGNLAGLRVLDVGDNNLATEALKTMLSPRLRGLHTLSLAGNKLDAAAGKVLADWEGLESVRFLDLSGNRIGDGLLPLLSSPRLGPLVSLGLRKCGIGPTGAGALAAAAALSRLARLDLSENPLGTTGLTALCRSPTLANLMDLSLSRTGLDTGCGSILARAEWHWLARLDLSHHKELPAGNWQALTGAGWLRRLRELDLSKTSFADAEVRALVEAAPGNLCDLILVASGAGDEAAAALAGWPGLARLSRLDLTHAQVDHAGLRALASSQYLRRPGVVLAHIENSDFSDRGLQGDRRFVLTF
jgi:uncharacterized protein (TIGR02996 family)